MNEWEIQEIFEKEKAVERGHFQLSSGLHSDTYVQCARVLQHPHLSESLADEIAKGLDEGEVDVIVSPALGGIIIGYMVGLALGKRMLFAERVGENMELRRSQELLQGDRVLVVEDVITTGGSVRELMEMVTSSGAVVIGVGALIERGEDRDFGVPKKVLLRIDASAWDPSQCPLCRKEVKLEIPGSRNPS
jgi:orotate phosphoribosyltransferase